MNKYGEIKRFTHENFQYIIGTEKIEAPHLKDELYIPYIYFHISRKSSKKLRNKSLSKSDKMFSLVSKTWNLELSRKILNVFREYLETVKPRHISFSVYGSRLEKEKRTKFYIKRLNEMNYELVKADNETWEDCKVYFLERNNA